MTKPTDPVGDKFIDFMEENGAKFIDVSSLETLNNATSARKEPTDKWEEDTRCPAWIFKMSKKRFCALGRFFDDFISHAIQDARDEVIRKFATGEFVQSDIAKKFAKEAEQQGMNKLIAKLPWKSHKEVKKVRDAIQDTITEWEANHPRRCSEAFNKGVLKERARVVGIIRSAGILESDREEVLNAINEEGTR